MITKWLIFSGVLVNLALLAVLCLLAWELLACMIRSVSMIRFYFAVANEHGWKTNKEPTLRAVTKQFFWGIGFSWNQSVREITGEGGVWRGVGNWRVYPRKDVESDAESGHEES